MKRTPRREFDPPPERSFVAPTDVQERLQGAPSPTIPEAAAFLRRLAQFIEAGVLRFPEGEGEDEARARCRLRLYVLAECIEGPRAWRHRGKLTVKQRELIDAMAAGIDNRPRGTTVDDALEAAASQIAKQWRMQKSPDHESIVGLLVEARKRRGKVRRPGTSAP